MEGGYILGAIIALFIWGVILTSIISSGAQTTKRLKNDDNIIRLLKVIAEKLGASPESIDPPLRVKKKSIW